MKGLKGKVAIVTGASSGIGEACARRLAAEGVKTVLAARRLERMEAIVGELNEAGAEAVCFATDVSDEEAVRRTIDSTISRYGRLDIVINNAGISRPCPIEEMDRAVWDRILAVNLTGTALCIKHCVPQMKRQNSGAIVNMSSIHDLVTTSNMGAYPATKSGQAALTRQLGLELGPYGIRVNGIQPGYVPTELSLPDWTREGHGDPQVFINRLKDSIALRRVGGPEEIAAVAAFLASDESSYVNGTMILVDGGVAMQLYGIEPSHSPEP
jgi:NAD(P)-dependent dehydrogenase (short-subunit alcohol dehydrogenase family)